MKKEELIGRLMDTFCDEMDEHLAVLNRDLLSLEKTVKTQPAYDELLRSVFRSVHSLRGASRSVDLTFIAVTCHPMEELFAAIQEGKTSLEAGVYKVLLKMTAALMDVAKTIRDKNEPDSSALFRLTRDLEDALAITNAK